MLHAACDSCGSCLRPVNCCISAYFCSDRHMSLSFFPFKQMPGDSCFLLAADRAVIVGAWIPLGIDSLKLNMM